MKQENTVRFVSDDEKIVVSCTADTPLGELHDFLLQLKGNIVERISAAQAQEQAAADEVKGKEEPAVEGEVEVPKETK